MSTAVDDDESTWRTDVFVVDNVVSDKTTAEVLAFVEAAPDEDWQPFRPNRGFRRSRLNFGREGQPELPPVLRAFGEEAFQSAKRARPDAPWGGFEPNNLIVNRYEPGDGVAAHQDPVRKQALALCVTLNKDPQSRASVMEFAGLANPKKDRKQIITRHKSAYCFHDGAYRRATHSRKASKRQSGRVYSFRYAA